MQTQVIMNKRLLVQSIVIAAIFIVSALFMRESKHADALFTILIASYGATIAATRKPGCFRRLFHRN